MEQIPPSPTGPPLPLLVAPTRPEFAAVQRGVLASAAAGRVRAACCGAGEYRVRRFCQALPPGTVSQLVLIGWAGGLVPELAAGETICANEVLAEGRPALACAPLPLRGARTGPILTVPRALFTPEEKIQARLSGGLAVEMEAYPLADWAGERGIPFSQVRLILDAWDEPLPDPTRLANLPALPVRVWALFRRIRALNPRLESLAREAAEGLA